MSDISTFLGISEVRDVLDTYMDGGFDEEQLIDQLAQMRGVASDESNDALATVLSEMVGRVEMIHLNICRAEQRHAIVEVLVNFKKHHLDAAK